MKRISLLALFLASLLILLACSPREEQSQPTSRSQSTVSPKILDGLDAREALALANKWQTSNPKVTSFITPEKISFEFPNKKTVKISLPEDSMMVALAPYVNSTHPCETHYMSGCQGELVDVPIKVLALQVDGTVLIDRTMKTMSNGFIELWLPRNKNISLTLESMDGKAEGEITTFSDSNTCITTFQLL
ncbi:MAG TPA: hypothetical protein ENI06_02065 [Spirochaetales bacterium]|nr:hypothetical protein [Spirochaetales bacterium]